MNKKKAQAEPVNETPAKKLEFKSEFNIDSNGVAHYHAQVHGCPLEMANLLGKVVAAFKNGTWSNDFANPTKFGKVAE